MIEEARRKLRGTEKEKTRNSEREILLHLMEKHENKHEENLRKQAKL